MNVTVNGITAKVEWEGFRKSRADGGPQVVIRYQVDFADADAFADSVMGGIVVTGGPGGTVHNLPRQYCPTNPRLYALSADVDYFGERDDAPPPTTPPALPGPPVLAFDTAVVTVVYGLLTWAQIPDDDPGGQQSFPNEITPNEPYLFSNSEIDFGYENVAVPKGALAFATSPNLQIGAPVTIRVPMSTWRLTRHNYPALPYALVVAKVGNCNDGTFLGQPKGCVLFDDARTRQTMQSDGTRTQGFELVFKVKVRDWNMFIRPDTLQWDLVKDQAGGGFTPYSYTDLKSLMD